MDDLKTYVKLVLESRPMPLERDSIEELARELVRIVCEFQDVDEDGLIGEHEVLYQTVFDVKDVKTKTPIVFPVYVRSYYDDPSGNVFLGAGAGMVANDGRSEFMVEIDINGSYTPYKIKKMFRYDLLDEIYSALLHEFTHASDHRHGSATVDYKDEDGNIDDDKYHNDPREMRAFTQEAVMHTLRRASSTKMTRFGTRDEYVEYVTNNVPMRRSRKFMTPKNFQKLMKTVIAELERTGHFAEA